MTMKKLFRSRVDYLAIAPAALLAFAGVVLIWPPSSGPLALALLLEAHLFILTLLVFTPIALLGRARALGLALVVVFVVGGGLFGSEWVSLPGSGGGRNDLSVMTWNLQAGASSPADRTAVLDTAPADVIALQELQPDLAAAIEADPTLLARYPYRTLAPNPGVLGVGVLSRYPFTSANTFIDAPGIELVVQTPRGPVTVINAHGEPHPDLGDATVLGVPFPVQFDPSGRNAAIGRLRTRIDAALSGGVRLVVAGDFNTSPSEAEYRVLTRGLRDTHVEVGEGPGWTWRPSRFAILDMGILRIDLQLSGGAIVPVSTSVDCSLAGDHCRLFGTYQIN